MHTIKKTMAALALLEDFAIGRKCVFRDWEDLLAYDDNWLISRFEGNPSGTVCRAAAGVGVQQLVAMRCLCPQEMCTLGFKQPVNAEGAGQPIGTVPKASRTSRMGRNYLHLCRYIKYAQCSWKGQHKIAIRSRAGFPNVIGANDCTQIAIKAPSHDEFVHVNRKHFHSNNVQIICDAQMQLTNIVARWPSSMHDSYILSNTIVGNRLQGGTVRNGWLLGE